jgi:DNA-binding CsgD family transcriptional regulator
VQFPNLNAPTGQARPQENTVSIAPSNNGFLLLDAGMNLIASNHPAVQILSFSNDARINQSKISLAERVRITILACNESDSLQPSFAVLLERDGADNTALVEVSAQFGLTHRECEAVDYLLQGLTSKEIADRMKISPNTVKAFLRLVMVKMKVSTRSGIAGKIAASGAGNYSVRQPIAADIVNRRREYSERQ